MIITLKAKNGNNPAVKEVVRIAKRSGVIPIIKSQKGANQDIVVVMLKDGIVESRTLPERLFWDLEGVIDVTRVSLAKVSLFSNGENHSHTIKLADDLFVGEGHPTLPIMGPCTIDPFIGKIVKDLKKLGVRAIRGGAWKPRGEPGSYRGPGEKGVHWFIKTLKENDVEAGFIEVLIPEHIKIVSKIKKEVGFSGVIVLWVGAHTESKELLTELGNQTEFPIMIKNGKNDQSVKDLISRAEWALANPPEYDDFGRPSEKKAKRKINENIMLCLRGTRTEEPSLWRNDPNYHWADTLRNKGCWAPICMDVSHIAGSTKNLEKSLDMALRFDPNAIMIEAGYPMEGFSKKDINSFKGACDIAQTLPIEDVPRFLEKISTSRK